MLKRPLLFTLALLLSACASDAPPPSTPSVPEPPTADIDTEVPLPADFHAVSGRLEGAAAGSDIELALLQIDGSDRPQRMLATLKLKGTGAPIPFRLAFNPEKYPVGQRVELHGRVTQSGMLSQKLPPRRVNGPDNQELGRLVLVPAP
ncbi:YbaY family lipoprotein [Pseudomonas sp. Marseille-QA0892]